jgi:hypothetical protein
MRISSPPIGGLTTPGGAEAAIASGSALIEFPPARLAFPALLDVMAIDN